MTKLLPSLLFIFHVFGSILVLAQNPQVVMNTEYGDIVFEIYVDKAPISSTNFLRYVDEDRWLGAHFYRVVTMENQPYNDIKIEVIQGGLDDSDSLRLATIKHEPTNETGIKHLNGTLSMARMEPGTESSEFFICIGDQPELDFGGRRNPDGQGFSAFGQVVRGMEVVKTIQGLKGQADSPQYLLNPVAITIIRRND